MANKWIIYGNWEVDFEVVSCSDFGAGLELESIVSIFTSTSVGSCDACGSDSARQSSSDREDLGGLGGASVLNELLSVPDSINLTSIRAVAGGRSELESSSDVDFDIT